MVTGAGAVKETVQGLSVVTESYVRHSCERQKFSLIFWDLPWSRLHLHSTRIYMMYVDTVSRIRLIVLPYTDQSLIKFTYILRCSV